MASPKPWEPTQDERDTISTYVAMGFTQEQIAAIVGRSVDSLSRRCPEELKNGAAIANAKIGGALFQKAMGGDTASLIFWCKTRMGWKEPKDDAETKELIINIMRLAGGITNGNG